MKDERKESVKWSRYYLWGFLALICMVVALFSCGQIWKIYNERQAAIEEYDTLREKYKPDAEQQEEQGASLTEVNPDYVGWLQMPGIHEEYPIVCGEDNDKYLHTTFEGQENAAGAIFMDYRNIDGFSSSHTIIYGHRMNNGTMFGKLHYYLEEQYREQNSNIIIILPNGTKKSYSIIDARITDAWDYAYQVDFAGDDALRAFFREIGVPEDCENLLTLSTCASGRDRNKRILVHAVLLKTTEISEEDI